MPFQADGQGRGATAGDPQRPRGLDKPHARENPWRRASALALVCFRAANCLTPQRCYLETCSTFKEGSGADGGEGAESMWAMLNQIGPTMAPMTLVRLIALEIISAH